MTEQWKSNPRKFCDFCKCWLSASKAATDFHERGKNHQENVKRRLAEIKKKSIDKRNDDADSKQMFEQMERDALDAVQKDIANDSSSVGRLDMKNLEKAKGVSSIRKEESSMYPWRAIVAPQGHTYYYNSITGESTWTKPAIVEEAERKTKLDSERPDPPPVDNRRPLTGGNSQLISNNQQFHSQSPEESSHNAVVIETFGEVTNPHPILGGWQTVTRTYLESPSTDNCLTAADRKIETNQQTTTNGPQTASENTLSTASTDETSRISGTNFKEKILKKSLTSETESSRDEVVFKKRKFGAGKSTRKRTNDED